MFEWTAILLNKDKLDNEGIEVSIYTCTVEANKAYDARTALFKHLQETFPFPPELRLVDLIKYIRVKNKEDRRRRDTSSGEAIRDFYKILEVAECTTK